MGNHKPTAKPTDGYDLEAMSIADATALMLKPSLGRSRVKVEYLAEQVQMPVSSLYEMIRDERPLSAKLVPLLTRLTGDPLLLASLAAKSGYVLFPLPETRHAAGRNFLQQQAVTLKKQAALVETIADAMDPDTGAGTYFTDEELRQLDLAITELVAGLIRLRDTAEDWRCPDYGTQGGGLEGGPLKM